MDEQRSQAYLTLIEQLLNCPQGQEGELLQAHPDLLDAELLEVMEQVAAYLESQRSSNAQWLRGFAAQLAEVLDLETSAPRGTKTAHQFLLETLQLIVDKRFDPQQIYPLWAQQQTRFSTELLTVLPAVAAQLFEENADQRTYIAELLGEFGNLIQQFPLGIRWLNLELGIAAYQQAMTVRTRDAMPVDWARTMMNLAIAYRNRIWGDRGQNIEEAIAAYEQSLQVITREAMLVDWAQSMMNLATAYLCRIWGDRAQNIEEAIAAYEQSLQVMTQDAMPIEWATSMNNLATAYSARIRGDRGQNIEDAIAAYEQSLQVMTQDAMPVEWARTMMNLATAYRNRIWGDHGQNIEEAIAAYEQSLQVRTREAMPVDWAGTMNNLANAYSVRIRGDRGQNIEEAIAAYEQSLQVMTQDAMPIEWARTMNNLATAYRNRIWGDHGQNIEDAIAACEQSLQVRTREAMPVEWAISMNNLANAYSDRILGDRGQNIEEAIAAYKQSLQVRTREAMPVDWARTMNNLALAYANRIRGDHGQNIEEAIAAYKQSLQMRTREAMPVEWAGTMNNLANAYSDRIRGDRAQNIEDAIKAYEASLEIFTPELLPNDCRRSARSLANLYFAENRWGDAVSACQTALQAAEILYQSANLLDGKAAELAETADLPRRAAYALARTGDLQKAVETLEQGRARGLSESLDRDRADLTQLQQTHPELYQDYQQITAQLRNLESQQRDRMTSEDRHSLTPEALRDTATSLRQQLADILQDIRKVPSYEDFLGLPTFADVQAAATDHPPLVYLVTTPADSLALVVTPNTVESLWLDIFNETQLIELLNKNWVAAYRQFQSNPKGWYDAIDYVTHQLWESLMAPLVAHLQQHQIQQAILIPTGYLSALPLHAAWTEDPSTPTGRRYALDDIHFTYAPNAKSLTAAQAIDQRTGADSILAIDNPREDLPNSSREVTAATDTFPQPIVLKHKQATVEAVKTALPQATIAHFSCHGTANLTDPLNSGLAMSDGLLTLKDIFALNLAEHGGIRLAVLSACETGLSGIENADEAISLPTGLLQAGVAGVVASLWSVSELSTMVLLSRFYTLWQNQHMSPATALRCAQQWLRDASPTDIVDHCRTFIPDLDSHKELKRSLKYDYSHPYHWSAFSYTGV
jgi:CHAT domain-containing protein